MAITNRERIGKAMDLLRSGLTPFVDRGIQAAVKANTVRMDAMRRFAEDPMLGIKAEAARDLAYGLYMVSERKKRAAEALSYSALVQSWPEILRLAQEDAPARDLFEAAGR
jgi:hypothetical protein